MADSSRNNDDSEPKIYDAIVIGSGFAGAVTACRLAEAGVDVCILERGRRFNPSDELANHSTAPGELGAHPSFPVYPSPASPNVPSDAPKDGRSTVQPDVSRFFWALGNGIWDFRDLGDVLVGQAAGYGGGSLIYANVHLRPPEHVFDERWPIKRKDLEDYYDLVAMNLEVAPLPKDHAGLPKRVQLERAATVLEQLHCERGLQADPAEPKYLRSFSPPLAVRFRGQTLDNPVPDDESSIRAKPKPWQGVCDLAGNCCLGCPQRAKNTLDFNYLHRAETAGNPATVRTLAEVVGIERKDRSELFKVTYRNHLAGGAEQDVEAKYVFLCAGAVNTTELLLRCTKGNKLEMEGRGLGTYFHPNQDNLSAVFECDEPQELDRGPTITSTLLYDREPEDDESTARWRIGFSGAAFEPSVGAEIECAPSGRALVASPPYVISGSFEQGDAKGELTLSKLQRDFGAGEELKIKAKGSSGKREESKRKAKRWADLATGPHKSRHWFLIQDGGLPVGMEPSIGIFRSPLWLGRNGFREKQRHPGEEDWPKQINGHSHEADEHAAASKRIGYAALPIEALTDLFVGLTRRAVGADIHETSELGLQLLRESDFEPRESKDKERWGLLPDQLDRALRTLKRRTLDRVGLASEGIVASFVDDAAKSMSKDLDPALAKLGKVDAEEIRQLNLAARALRLGTQVLWGSQAGMARAIANELVSRLLPGDGALMEAGVDLLKLVLDYRLGNGRTAMLLSFGLDSVPGKLQLEAPTLEELGAELRGAKSGTRAFVLQRRADQGATSGGKSEAGTMIVTRMTGDFEVGETLVIDREKVGTFERDEKRKSETPLELHEIHYKPNMNSVAMTAPLRASLPAAIDTPERGVQERALRDIASAWGGELRTDPQWTFLHRRLTVHAQGGCPMGRSDPKDNIKAKGEGVTNEAGELRECPGLYVMDAAAFPGPVGANPSATIAAVAEYKVEKFLKENWLPTLTGHKDKKRVDKLKEDIAKLVEEREKAKTWVTDQGRKELDPLGPGEDAKPRLQSVEPAHRPVGIEFTEKMEGTVAMNALYAIESELKVKIDDLSGFLARHSRDAEVRVPIIDGTIKLTEQSTDRTGHSGKQSSGDSKNDTGSKGGAEVEAQVDRDESYMLIMSRNFTESGREARRIHYHIVASDGGTKYVLDGHKNLEDDPGFDAWEDTTTLNFALEKLEGSGTPVTGEGKLRLPASEFFGNQLRSFRADTDDPARQAWALASFGRFFFGNLVDVYFPGLDKLGDLGVSTMRRGHG
jgi:choline dehydrogenase-like flavoprotein